MTIEQADKIAEVVRSAPRMYDSIPSLEEGMKPVPFNSTRYSAYPWISLANSLGGLLLTDAPKNPNVYFSDYGFSGAYSSTIKDWEATEIVRAVSFGQRYVTIDDIRMMAFLGIEYARAKFDGWRYRFGYVSGLDREAAYIPKGGIVRIEDGFRYVHRSSGNITAPPGSGGPYSDEYYAYKFWTPMKRLPGYGNPENGYIDLPAEFEMPSEATSEIVLLGSIEGADDIVKFNPHFEYRAVRSSIQEGYSIVKSGGFEIVLSMSESISEDSLADSLVVYQQRVQNDYTVFGDRWDYTTKEQPSSGEKYATNVIVEGNGSMVALRKGVVYNVFAKFDNAVLTENKFNPDRHLVSYVRTGTRKVAPYMWSVGSNTPHQYPA